MEKYQSTIEGKMKLFYDNLSEKDRRHYAAIEALKLSHGGYKYISNLFKCSRQTLARGLKDLDKNLLTTNKSRCAGGGRKSCEKHNSAVNKIFLKCT